MARCEWEGGGEGEGEGGGGGGCFTCTIVTQKSSNE